MMNCIRYELCGQRILVHKHAKEWCIRRVRFAFFEQNKNVIGKNVNWSQLQLAVCLLVCLCTNCRFRIRVDRKVVAFFLMQSANVRMKNATHLPLVASPLWVRSHFLPLKFHYYYYRWKTAYDISRMFIITPYVKLKFMVCLILISGRRKSPFFTVPSYKKSALNARLRCAPRVTAAKHRKIFTTCTASELKFAKYGRAIQTSAMSTLCISLVFKPWLRGKLLTVASKSVTFFHHFINIIPISLDLTLPLVVIFALYILGIVILSLFFTLVSPWPQLLHLCRFAGSLRVVCRSTHCDRSNCICFVAAVHFDDPQPELRAPYILHSTHAHR